jgi:hypothetical protein
LGLGQLFTAPGCLKAEMAVISSWDNSNMNECPTFPFFPPKSTGDGVSHHKPNSLEVE